jgi:hypothetical protein
VKHDSVKLFLSHVQPKLGISQEHEASKLVVGELAGLHALKFRKLPGVLALNPQCFVGGEGFVRTLRSVLVLKTVLNDLVLQCAYGSDYLSSVGDERKQLGYTFIHQLVHTYGQLLGFHGVRIVDEAKVFGRKGRNSAKVKRLAAR